MARLNRHTGPSVNKVDAGLDNGRDVPNPHDASAAGADSNRRVLRLLTNAKDVPHPNGGNYTGNKSSRASGLLLPHKTTCTSIGSNAVNNGRDTSLLPPPSKSNRRAVGLLSPDDSLANLANRTEGTTSAVWQSNTCNRLLLSSALSAATVSINASTTSKSSSTVYVPLYPRQNTIWDGTTVGKIDPASGWRPPRRTAQEVSERRHQSRGRGDARLTAPPPGFGFATVRTQGEVDAGHATLVDELVDTVTGVTVEDDTLPPSLSPGDARKGATEGGKVAANSVPSESNLSPVNIPFSPATNDAAQVADCGEGGELGAKMCDEGVCKSDCICRESTKPLLEGATSPHLESATTKKPVAEKKKRVHCGRTSHAATVYKRAENKTCYVCAQRGHIARDCPDRYLRRCFVCGRPGHVGAPEGHIARDCPERRLKLKRLQVA